MMDPIINIGLLLGSLALVFWGFGGYRLFHQPYTPQPQTPPQPDEDPPVYQGHNRISSHFENQKYWMN